MAMRPLAPGTRWQVGPWADRLGGKMVVIEQLVQSDELLPADMRTMEELRKMGNSICEIIQLEEDFPSKHDDQKLPILDLKVNVEKVQINGEPLGRQLREGVEIVGGQQDILLNSKEEFLQGAVPSSRTQRGFGQ